jgi:hypothetical protein
LKYSRAASNTTSFVVHDRRSLTFPPKDQKNALACRYGHRFIRGMSSAAPHHLAELAEILAAGLLRLRSRKSSPNSPCETDSPLDCEPVFGRHETGNFKDSER